MTYEVTLDLSKAISLTYLNMALEDEGNVIKATFTNNSEPYTMAATHSVKFAAYKPDGTIIFGDTGESEGEFSYTDESGQLCLVKGKVMCRFIIAEGTGASQTVKNSPWFTVVVNNSDDVTPSVVAESDDDLAAINRLFNKLDPVINDVLGLLAKFPINTPDIANEAITQAKLKETLYNALNNTWKKVDGYKVFEDETPDENLPDGAIRLKLAYEPQKIYQVHGPLSPSSGTYGYAFTESPAGPGALSQRTQYYFTLDRGILVRRTTNSSPITWGDWKQIAFLNDIPTNTSDLTNDSGFMQPQAAVTTSNYSDYSDANDFTPNRIYTIYPNITAQMVANLPVYGAVGHLMYYTCGAAVKAGIQIYCTRDEMWFRRMNSSGAETWKKLIDTTALNTAFAAQNDTSLSESGKFADAAAAGAALASCFKYVSYTPSSASDVLTRFEAYTCCLAAASAWADTPVSSGTGMVLSIKNAAGNYGLQLWISSTPASGDPGYFGIYIRRYSGGSWTNWFSLVDSTLTKAGVAADAKATGDRISEVAFKTTGKYYAFGDSLVKAQIGRWSGPTQYSTKGYVDTTAKILHMPFNNQAVGGQGLIKDWALIIDTINALDMSDAGLITVGWSGNDTASWRLPTCAMGTYTDVTTVDVTDANDVKSLVTYESGVPVSVGTTVMGFYYTIMKLLQTKCPKAQIVLVSGYGTPGGNSSQHILAQLTDQFTHMTTYGTGGNHTTKERYDELEKMANIHGWPCVNQAKGCCFNEFNAPYVFGDQAHPTDEGYAMYGNSLANRIAAFYANRDV